MQGLREKIDNISREMTDIRESIDELENSLFQLIWPSDQSDSIYKALDKYEEEYWKLRDERDKYIAWGN
jgi:uncharacterized coiled-coil DUF342 family protein